jgi:hypothetical protein
MHLKTIVFKTIRRYQKTIRPNFATIHRISVLIFTDIFELRNAQKQHTNCSDASHTPPISDLYLNNDKRRR